jgi:predicted DNA-binding transcriptional regulator AlpA
LTLKQVAEAFGVCDESVRRWVRAKTFPQPATPTKSRWLFRTSDIMAFLDARQAEVRT